jgi:hypothetical protein
MYLDSTPPAKHANAKDTPCNSNSQAKSAILPKIANPIAQNTWYKRELNILNFKNQTSNR